MNDRKSNRRFPVQMGGGPGMTRRGFIGASAYGALSVQAMAAGATGDAVKRPNILFAIADDWSWPHAGAYGARFVSTPVFDRVAREGCLFTNAFVAAPQCSPNRAATLTGRSIWQIAEAGTHASIFPDTFPVFPGLLEEAGYHVGFTGKGWGPGDFKRGGWERNPAGPEFSKRRCKSVPASGISRTDYAGNFQAFLEQRPKDAPFCFWYGSHEPHRGYEPGSGLRAGKRLEDAVVPPFLPDTPEVRSDILDYALEVEYYDRQLGEMLHTLDAAGELDNTLVVVTSDNGMPFPRAKATLYEYGTHMPLAIRWPAGLKLNGAVDALLSFIDFAPTFLDVAGVTVPASMTGHSFLGFLTGRSDEAPRDAAFTGRERHTHARFDNLGYPARAIRTADHLYIRNLKPDRWPAGDPEGYHDIDGSPTKDFMMAHGSEYGGLFDMAFGKHPGEELYDIQADPGCLHDLAQSEAHASVRDTLRTRLEETLTDQGDPRMLGTGDIFDSYPRVSTMRPQLGGFAERGEYNPKYRPDK